MPVGDAGCSAESGRGRNSSARGETERRGRVPDGETLGVVDGNGMVELVPTAVPSGGKYRRASSWRSEADVKRGRGPFKTARGIPLGADDGGAGTAVETPRPGDTPCCEKTAGGLFVRAPGGAGIAHKQESNAEN